MNKHVFAGVTAGVCLVGAAALLAGGAALCLAWLGLASFGAAIANLEVPVGGDDE